MKKRTLDIIKRAQAVGLSERFEKLKKSIPESLGNLSSNLVSTATNTWNSIPEELQEEIVMGASDWAKQRAFAELVNRAYPNLNIDDIVDHVNTFYNNLVIPTKERYGGVPGEDYDSENYIPDYIKTKPKIVQEAKLFSPVYGYVSPYDIRSKIHLNKPTLKYVMRRYPDILKSVIAHEATHAQNKDARILGKSHTGVSKVETQKLRDAYPFSNDIMRMMYPTLPSHALSLYGDQERAAVNREYRLAIADELEKATGSAPNIDEFESHIDSMPDEEVQRIYNEKVHNGYMDAVRRKFPKLTPQQIQYLKKAWKEVAKNQKNMNMPGYSGLRRTYNA